MQFIDWQPGNGSRYPLMFATTPNGGWFIAYLWRSDVGGPCFKWRDNYVHLSYMMEKMGITNEYDAQAIGAFLLTQGIQVELGWGQQWYDFQRAEELGFDKLLKAS